ncbi:MAG TPA: MerR family DNA-binding transcriptional regulator [Gaiellaceae bacterium]|nr:MerR family DNA-binding transcriptional regulator [Gaiellaceae bacterium]
MQIGEAAERVGLSLRTLRYWEEIGLLVPSRRTAGGFRLYSEGDLKRVAILKSMKPLGLTRDQMKELLALVETATAAETLSTDELASVIAGLGGWIEETSEAIEKLERRIGEAHRLRLRLGEALAVCETTRRLRGTVP